MKNLTSIVLGGTRGIGGAIGDRLSEISSVSRYSSLEVDTGNLENIDRLIKENPKTDVLVLNTGGPPAIDFFNITDDHWEKYHNQLFLGFCKVLQNIRINDGGFVFLVSSFNIKEPNPNLILSNAYRLAFVSVFKSLSKIMAERKVSFINIAPGPIKTDRLRSLVSELDEFEKTLPMKYAAEPDEIARFVKSIVEQDISYLSGVSINFDGALSNYIL
jgi:3-oxoacyl-[acyl-carrier protein] reductase